MDTSTPPAVSPPPAPLPKSGGRKWIVLGCGGCLTLIVLGLLAFAGIFFFVIGVIKKTDVYADAVKVAQQSADVQTALGSPVEAGWMLQGSVNYNNGAGNADFNVPLSGPNGKATMAVKAKKPAGGPWEYEVLEVRVPGGSSIDLRESR